MKISIIIPVYNCQDYLSTAIESALEAQSDETEVIVIDDGSTDRSPDIAYGFSSIKVFRQINGGLSAARNKGISMARGKFLKFLDADDRLCTDNLLEQVSFLEQNSSVDVVYSDFVLMNERTQVFSPDISTTSDLVAKLFTENLNVAACLYRKEALVRSGCFNPSFRVAEDYELHLRMASQGFVFAKVQGISFEYRVHNAPSRITVAKQNAYSRITAEERLRYLHYLDLLVAHYSSLVFVPSKIKRCVGFNALNRACFMLLRFHIRDAMECWHSFLRYHPSWFDLAWVVVMVTRSKLLRVFNILHVSRV